VNINSLEERVQRLEDTLEIYNLQSRYQYYLTTYTGSRVEELFAKNGKTANGQWFLIGPAVLPTRNDAKDKEHLEAMWMFGRYNIDYVKEDGVWLFKRFGVELHFLSSVTTGWVESPFPFAVRAFESEEGTKPEGTGTFPHLYRPNGPNDYGPAPPEAKRSNSQ